MDFIERIFHIAPDAGTGVFEITLMLAFFLVPLAAVVLRKVRVYKYR